MDDVDERFRTLAQRELSADDVRLLAPGDVPPKAVNVIVAQLRDGRHVVASFGAEPKNAAALLRRLSMLVNTFADAMGHPTAARAGSHSPHPPPVTTSLHDELEALAVRARALDAFVIDADSPVVWGRASAALEERQGRSLLMREIQDRELGKAEASAPIELHVVPRSPKSVRSEPLPVPTAPTGNLRIAPPAADSSATDTTPMDDADSEDVGLTGGEPTLTVETMRAVRALPSLALLHKGKHLRELSREAPAYLVLSFSSIYLLGLVFDGEFDELRAERAAQQALPRVERLVLAIPPHDPAPQPIGGVVALRRPRRS